MFIDKTKSVELIISDLTKIINNLNKFIEKTKVNITTRDEYIQELQESEARDEKELERAYKILERLSALFN